MVCIGADRGRVRRLYRPNRGDFSIARAAAAPIATQPGTNGRRGSRRDPPNPQKENA